ncbi:MAG TPA: peptidoglycan editing factor PgeF [Anaerolineae bacterium]|nr:peptidoglycan editing factor PgeF [Anaerolineae bacterium]HQJ51176.1 peptidoglycan editing factor PgeF [Anaerolineae bacterium]
MIRCQSGGVSYYEFESLHHLRAIRHAVLTRHGGVSVGPLASLNVGHSVGDDPAAVTENTRRAVAVLGARMDQVVTAHQVHGARVVLVGHKERGSVVPSCDGLATAEPNVVLMLRFADCVPVLLVDPVHRAVALLHSGWRGWASGVVAAGLRLMSDEFGTRPSDLVAGIGPAIGPCCYEVGPEVVAAALKVLGPAGDSVVSTLSGATHLDLPGAVRMQLETAGVVQIEVSGVCTGCRRDEFYSHRGDGGKTGRFAVVVSLAD